MRWWDLVWTRTRSLLFRRRIDRELDEELQLHLERAVEQKVAEGLSASSAREAALREFGSIGLVREACRDGWGTRLVHEFIQDLRYGARTLSKAPGFTLTATVTLAIAIGAATAVYSYVNGVLLRPPDGVRSPDEVVVAYLSNLEAGDFQVMRYSHFTELSQNQAVLSDLMGFFHFESVLGTGTSSELVTVQYVTGNLFSGLGIPMLAGRGIQPQDDRPGTASSIVLSERVWESHFGRAQDVIGRVVQVNGHAFTVVGVAAALYEGLQYNFYGVPDIWIPLHATDITSGSNRIARDAVYVTGIGRLKSGVSVAEAEAGLSLAASRLSPRDTGLPPPNTVVLRPIAASRADPGVRAVLSQLLGMLFAVSILILAAACVNVANFLIGSGVTRRAELALRLAVGATRRRIFQQLLTESLLLGAIGGCGGLLVAFVVSDLFELYPPISSAGYALEIPAVIDGSALLFAAALTLVATLGFGGLAAFLVSFRNPMRVIRNGDSSLAPARAGLSRRILLGTQVAMSVVLAVVASQYLVSLSNINRVNYTFNEDNVLLARVYPGALSPADRAPFYEQLLADLESRPDVLSATIASNPPLSIGGVYVEDASEVTREADYALAGPNYFKTLEIPIVAGAEFEAGSPENGVVVNSVLAAASWPAGNAVGQIVTIPALFDSDLTVIGVVDQPRCQDLLDEPRPCIYRKFGFDRVSGILHLRTRDVPEVIIPTLVDTVREASPHIAIDRIRSLSEHVRTLRAGPRITVYLTSALALLTCLLTAIGCAALLSSRVSETRKELAIRLALGTTQARLMWRIAIGSLVPLASGILVGGVASWIIATVISFQLYQANTRDPLLFAVPCTIVAVIGLSSSYLTLHWVTKSDPAHMLRCE